ncbi:MAG: ABC transporter permease [Flavobacteriaceae bacterium]|nr:ABC transporter permease [Flavobacteriaceae bacterium]NVK83150.1 ABC transporter permease [Cytophagia bacterium]
MFKNNLKLILRKLRREKLYASVSILGLTIGLTAFLIITLYVRDELSYDKFHENHKELYRVFANDTTRNVKQGEIAPDLAGIIVSDIPAVKSVLRVVRAAEKNLLNIDDKSLYADRILFSDSNFFELLDFKLIDGTPESVLSEPYQMVITKTLAEKMFGDGSPIGKLVKLDKALDVVISGVCENPPTNSSLMFDAVVRSSVKEMDTPIRGGMMPVVTYLEIPEEQDLEQIAGMINQIKEKSAYDFFVKNEDFGLVSLADQRLYGQFSNAYMTDQSDIRFVYLFSGIGLVILLLAVINYINMVTASSLKRAKEIGLRKVIGAQKSQLIAYQLAESVVVTTIALFIAFVATKQILPLMNGRLNKAIELNYFSPEFLVFVPLLGLLIGVLTGLYPSFFISKYKPLVLMKNSGAGVKGKGGLRRVLVGFQFLVAGIMILVTLVMHSQMSFLEKQKMGFDKELLVYIPLFDDLKGQSQIFKNEVLGMSGVQSATITNWMFGRHSSSSVFADKFGIDVDERPPSTNINFVLGDEDLVNTLGLEIVESEDKFDFGKIDPTEIIISRLVAEKLGWKDESPLGKTVHQYDGDKWRVVAVIEDFHSSSLKEEILPSVILRGESWSFEELLVRFEAEGHQATLNEIKDKYEALLNRPFEFSYVDDAIDQYYKKEADQVALFNTFSGLAIFISLLGLMAMATYSAQQRKKEVSIRKVLGASLKQLIFMLNKENGVLVLVAFLIATPVTVYVMQDWLSEFKYRTNIQPQIFILAVFGFYLLNLMVTFLFSLKVSRENPADVLRDE